MTRDQGPTARVEDSEGATATMNSSCAKGISEDFLEEEEEEGKEGFI